ncbi:uncharacterized protein METZ01_LOCUS151323 [marine metagenome]|uniref:Uncharacterized protein n=1 Tax=marine metagenome TaxID=408172 RepID=A0A382AAP8_9ZZZZ
MGIDFIALFIWKYGLPIILIWVTIDNTCSPEWGSLCM